MFEQLVGKLPVGICVINEDFEIIYLNDFFLDHLPQQLKENYKQSSISELFPEQGKFLSRRLKSIFVLQHPSFSYWEQRPHIFPFKSSRPITGEETQMYQNMEIIPIRDTTSGERLACIFLQDVTAQASYFKAQQKLSEALRREHEKQRQLIRKLDSAQSQLIQAEKMASTGQLAAGIAHEINNPIGFINANIHTLAYYTANLIAICSGVEKRLDDFNDDIKHQIKNLFEANQYAIIKEDINELLEESTEGLTRVRDIVDNLKNFSIETAEGIQSVDVCQVGRQLISLISAQYNNIQYKFESDHDEMRMLVNPGSLKQALMNVMLNAAQAANQKGFVKLSIIDKGETVHFKILDSGSGISPQNLNRIFEPFFTTKPEGQGHGLGLSVAYTVIEQHQGKITINSKEGKGTIVEITLPKQDKTTCTPTTYNDNSTVPSTDNDCR